MKAAFLSFRHYNRPMNIPLVGVAKEAPSTFSAGEQ